jgi:flagellar basal-body rod protein FlgC
MCPKGRNGMTDVLSIALSGLLAQKQRLAASASNVANASTGGSIPSADPSAPASTVYKPLQVNLSSAQTQGAGVGVAATVVEKANGYSVSHAPDSPFADAQGMVAAPNVDLAEEALLLMEVKIGYKANISVMQTESEMIGELLDTIS